MATLPRRKFNRTAPAAEIAFSGVGGQAFGAYTYGPWGAGALGLTGGLLPGAKKDWAREVGHVWRNSAVSICLGWIADIVNEAQLVVTRNGAEKGKREPIDDHPLVRLIERPNHAYSGATLLSATALSFKADGNAYWIKSRGTGGWGAPYELWYVPHWQVFPQWPPGPTTTFIDHYKYVVDGKVYELPSEDVVHFRDGIDPLFPRLGLGRLKSLLRSICALNEAETYTASILANMGIPATTFLPIGDGIANYDLDEPAYEKLVERWQAATTGENRGRPFVTNLPVKPERIGLSPEELSLDRVHALPLQYVCAALKLNPHVVGLESGPSGFDSGGQRLEARRGAYEDCIIPMLTVWAKDGLQAQLLPDVGDSDAERCEWDWSGSQALAQNETEKTKRATDIFQSGLATRDEGRALIGLPPTGDEWGERYFDGSGGTEVGPGVEQAAIEPADTGDAEPDAADADEAAETDGADTLISADPLADTAKAPDLDAETIS